MDIQQTVDREKQSFNLVKKYIDMGATTNDLINAGFFHNLLPYPDNIIYKTCECCGHKYKNKHAIEERKEAYFEYSKEENRLIELFKLALCYGHGLTPEDSKVQKALGLAWDYGHSSGYHEIANYFEDLVQLLK